MKNVLYYCVDAQNDFLLPSGKLYVEGADKKIPLIEALVKNAHTNGYPIILSQDWHNKNSVEFSTNPDFKNTYPPHCIKNTKGANFTNSIENVLSEYEGVNCLNNQSSVDIATMATIARKDEFDVFGKRGNRFLKPYLKKHFNHFKTVVVFGCVYEVCVKDAVLGLQEIFPEVKIVKNATASFEPIERLEQFNDNVKLI